ncbi:MAG TPA: hypothetical protein VNR36_10900 [Pseudolysinimonas sp.]|nr:hypothetical protein [Pseudolysinimonas sp.]
MDSTDISPVMPRYLALVLATAATVIAIGLLWSLAPDRLCGGGDYVGILPGPQPCGDGGTVAALTTAGILLTLLAAIFVVSFTLHRHRRLVTLIIGGVMLLVLCIGLLATVAAASSGPVIYY